MASDQQELPGVVADDDHQPPGREPPRVPAADGEEPPRQEAGRRPGTHHPRLARERALKVLFQSDIRGVDARVLLDEIVTTRGALELLDELEPDAAQVEGDEELRFELQRRDRLSLDDYTRTLVAGVAAHRAAIDVLLGDVAQRWAVDRMQVVDRNLLRLAVYELALQDTPDPIVIDETLALAGAFAGGRTRPFINGILETIRQRVVAGSVDLGERSPVPVATSLASPPGGTPPTAPSPEAPGDASAEAPADARAEARTDAADGPTSVPAAATAEAPAHADDRGSQAGVTGDRTAAAGSTPEAARAWNEAVDLLADLDEDETDEGEPRARVSEAHDGVPDGLDGDGEPNADADDDESHDDDTAPGLIDLDALLDPEFDD